MLKKSTINHQNLIAITLPYIFLHFDLAHPQQIFRGLYFKYFLVGYLYSKYFWKVFYHLAGFGSFGSWCHAQLIAPYNTILQQFTFTNINEYYNDCCFYNM